MVAMQLSNSARYYTTAVFLLESLTACRYFCMAFITSMSTGITHTPTLHPPRPTTWQCMLFAGTPSTRVCLPPVGQTGLSRYGTTQESRRGEAGISCHLLCIYIAANYPSVVLRFVLRSSWPPSLPPLLLSSWSPFTLLLLLPTLLPPSPPGLLPLPPRSLLHPPPYHPQGSNVHL